MIELASGKVLNFIKRNRIAVQFKTFMHLCTIMKL